MKAGINEIETKKLYKESMKQKVHSLKILTRSINLNQHDKTEGGKTQINKIKEKKGDIPTNTNEIQKELGKVIFK
jgi:hypothetical protein